MNRLIMSIALCVLVLSSTAFAQQPSTFYPTDEQVRSAAQRLARSLDWTKAPTFEVVPLYDPDSSTCRGMIVRLPRQKKGYAQRWVVTFEKFRGEDKVVIANGWSYPSLPGKKKETIRLEDKVLHGHEVLKVRPSKTGTISVTLLGSKPPELFEVFGRKGGMPKE